jgi:hypothetical protein
MLIFKGAGGLKHIFKSLFKQAKQHSSSFFGFLNKFPPFNFLFKAVGGFFSITCGPAIAVCGFMANRIAYTALDCAVVVNDELIKKIGFPDLGLSKSIKQTMEDLDSAEIGGKKISSLPDMLSAGFAGWKALTQLGIKHVLAPLADLKKPEKLKSKEEKSREADVRKTETRDEPEKSQQVAEDRSKVIASKLLNPNPTIKPTRVAGVSVGGATTVSSKA